MRHSIISTLAAVFIAASLPKIAQGAPVASAGAESVANSAAPGAALPIEDAQFVYGGRQHCWYNNGWKGPGWYWCGYAYRRGYGWGGGYGWNGWRGGYAGGGVWRGGGYHGGGYHGGGYHGGGWHGGGHHGGWHGGGHHGGGHHGGGHRR